MGFLTWVLAGTAVGLVWRSAQRLERLADVLTGIAGAVLLGAILRGMAEFDIHALRPVGVRLFTWPNLIQALVGSMALLLLLRREKGQEGE